MGKRFVLCVFLGLAFPILASAGGEDTLLLSEKDTKGIISAIQQEISKVGSTIEIFKYSAQEQAALTIVRSSSREIVLKFLPGFVSTETIKIIVSAVSSLQKISQITVKEILEQIEKETVKRAVQIGTDWLLSNEVKVGSGEISYNGGATIFQYVLSYKETGKDTADVALDFYSSNPIDPTVARGSIGTLVGTLGDSFSIDKIKPFIVHIVTRVKRYSLGWSAAPNADTKITVEFPEKVPVLKLSKELPYPFEEQKIKLLNYLNTARRIFDVLQSIGSETLGKTADFAHKVKETVKGVIIHTSQLLAKSGALLIDPFSQESKQIAFIESQLDSVKESLDAKEAEVKLNLIKNVAKLGETKDEVQPVENLIRLSFPQEEPRPESQSEISLTPNEPELVPIKEDILVPNKETKLSETKLCEIDPLQPMALGSIMFQEIAWAGSTNSPNDEWIKLKNISNGEVNLDGWRVIDKEKQISIVFERAHNILSQGSVLLERTNDDSLPGIAANLIYAGALSNTDEALYLFDENCVLRDKVAAAPDWPAGDGKERKSMERKSDLSWFTVGNASNPLQTQAVPLVSVVSGVATASAPAISGPPLVISLPRTYLKILISEIQVEGDGARDEFIELYNPNGESVDLADWKLTRKTSGGSDAYLVSPSAFSGTVGAYGYFLIVPQLNDDGTPNYKGSAVADLYYSGSTYSIAADNTIFLYNPNGQEADRVGFGTSAYAEGAAVANPSIGNSLSRKYENGTYQDTDNNTQDFVVQSPSAKAVNPAPAPPSSPPPPADTTAPAAVMDLSDSNPTTSTVQLIWTAPGDDGSTGTAASYDMRYSTAGITADNFNSATQVTGEPIPSTAGTSESMVISGLSAGTTYYFALKSSDEAANTSALSNAPSFVTTALPSPPQDTTSPQVTLDALASSQGNTDFILSWTITDSGGEASASGVQSIFVEYTVTPSVAGVFAQYNSNGVWTSWQTGSAGKITLNSQATSLSIRGQDGASYAFQVFASDVAGNISSIVNASTAVNLPKTVVINEIAWAGTKAQSTDEWIELLNTTGASVELTGWRVASSDSSGPEITLAGSIAANGFYLIERTDDQATTATAQLTASFGNGLSNTTCETLYLYNAENAVVDQTACASDGAWPAGTASPDYISMERIVSTAEGSSASNWASNNRIKYNNKDAGNNWINGTPGQTNSTATSPTTIAELRFAEFDTLTLTLLGSPYITTAGIISITVPAGKTLVIEPGVTVKFADNRGKLTVQGTLKAQGTQANGITFTTDGSTIWCGVKVASTSADSQLDYVTIDKAQSTGSNFCNESVNYAMYVDSSVVAISNSVIQTGSYHRKLYLKNSSSTINAVTISGATLNTESVGIYVDGGSPTISNSTISNNSTGIFVSSLANNPTIQNNTFTGNTKAVKLESTGAILSGNIATSNTYNGILFEGAVLNNTTWQADSMPYIVNKFTVSAGTTLTIQAGAAVKFINTPSTESEITVQGTLITQGTQANPVAFAGITDATTWKRIYIAPGSAGSQLAYTTITKGGNTYNEAALYVKQSNIQLFNVTISNSAYSGIYSFSGTITGSNVTLSNNTYGFHIQTGDCPALSAVTVTGTLLHPSSAVCSF